MADTENWLRWFKDRNTWAPLFLRLAVGIIFILHGYQKLTNLGGTGDFLAKLGIPLAAFMAGVVAVVEFLGGIAVLIGFFTRYASMLLALVMVVAIILVHWTQGFPGLDLPVALLASCLALVFMGPGKWHVHAHS